MKLFHPLFMRFPILVTGFSCIGSRREGGVYTSHPTPSIPRTHHCFLLNYKDVICADSLYRLLCIFTSCTDSSCTGLACFQLIVYEGSLSGKLNLILSLEKRHLFQINA